MGKSSIVGDNLQPKSDYAANSVETALRLIERLMKQPIQDETTKKRLDLLWRYVDTQSLPPMVRKGAVGSGLVVDSLKRPVIFANPPEAAPRDKEEEQHDRK